MTLMMTLMTTMITSMMTLMMTTLTLHHTHDYLTLWSIEPPQPQSRPREEELDLPDTDLISNHAYDVFQNIAEKEKPVNGVNTHAFEL